MRNANKISFNCPVHFGRQINLNRPTLNDAKFGQYLSIHARIDKSKERRMPLDAFRGRQIEDIARFGRAL